MPVWAVVMVKVASGVSVIRDYRSMSRLVSGAFNGRIYKV